MLLHTTTETKIILIERDICMKNLEYFNAIVEHNSGITRRQIANSACVSIGFSRTDSGMNELPVTISLSYDSVCASFKVSHITKADR